MGKETALPKNIRQIGDIQGNERICIEDYVATYIRKKEPQEEKGFLGIFFGERQEEEQKTYVYIRGILEMPEATQEETAAELFERERARCFPGWEVQGCCVIGTYPTRKLEELSAAVPEAGAMIYHLQEQEETLYWRDPEQYRRIRGYFVFYEQNRKMQEHLTEVFGEESIEKENLPERAIRSFREKVKEKSEQRTAGFLRIASSFFVITVLIIGVIVLNRIEAIRSVSGLPAQNAAALDGQKELQENAATLDGQKELQENAAALDGQNQLQEDALTLGGQKGLQENAAALDGQKELQENAAALGTQDGTQQDAWALSSGDGVQQNALDGGDVLQQEGETVSEQLLDEAWSAGTQDAAKLAGPDRFWEENGYEDESPDAQEDSDASVSGESDTQTTSGTAGAQEDTDAAESASDESDTQATSGTAGAQKDTDTAESAFGESDAQTTNGTAGTQEDAAEPDSAKSDAQTGESNGEPAAQEAAVRQTAASYIIKEGDTLATICSRYYGGMERLEELCKVNSIEDANMILPGQRILLP